MLWVQLQVIQHVLLKIGTLSAVCVLERFEGCAAKLSCREARMVFVEPS